ncbi:hypothetical protein BVY03_02970 [bacterium K02(2017)]|nr:hypothetical protein BVY03_02970 [bacterium K02(2017)]
MQLPQRTIQEVKFVAGKQIEDWGVKFLQAKNVHTKTKGDQAAIFILDTGAKYDHPDLAAHTLHQYAKNFSDSKFMDDKDGHSTHCAGLAAALDNNEGVLGVAPAAKLVPVKVLNDNGSGTWQGVASGIKYVADLENFPHRKIISMSLGARGGNPILEEAIEYAIKKGVFIVAAAGNDGYRGRDSVNYPAKYKDVLAIASLDPSGNASSFSSGGPDVNLAAPGRDTLSTYKGGKYVRMSGTSMATPHVAGAIALILSTNPNIKTQKELMDFLKQGATDLHKPGHDVRTGDGAPIMPKYFP